MNRFILLLMLVANGCINRDIDIEPYRKAVLVLNANKKKIILANKKISPSDEYDQGSCITKKTIEYLVHRDTSFNQVLILWRKNLVEENSCIRFSEYAGHYIYFDAPDEVNSQYLRSLYFLSSDTFDVARTNCVEYFEHAKIAPHWYVVEEL